MKKNLTLLIVLFLTSSLFSQNSLELYNNTGHNVWAAYGYYDNINKCWVTEGWYEILPYNAKIISLGSYVGQVYVHGNSTIKAKSIWENDQQVSWGKGYSLCVDKVAFSIRNADKIECENRRSFSETTIGQGVNKWTFNP